MAERTTEAGARDLGFGRAMVGIYGVMSYSVAQRTQEIGIRMAMGAQRHDILRLVFWETLKWVGLGIAVGLGLALALASTRILSSLLYHISANDTATYAGVSLLLTALAVLACFVPLRRATKVNPMVALRYE
jgi:ABC-type antimicrobial peptide transport system permease subunit